MLNRQVIINRKGMLYSTLALFFILGIGIYISFQNFLFFQVIANLFSIIIGMSMAIIAINTYEISQVQYFTFLGLTYGFVAFFDGLHIITHPEFNLFSYPLSISIKLWLIARMIQSISLFISFLLFYFKFRIRTFFMIYLIVSISSLYIIFRTDIFTTTTFGIIFFTIILISLSILTMIKCKEYFDEDIYYLLMFSMLTLLISNTFFINFLGERNTYNALGYVFKIISFYLLYKSINNINLKEPYKTLFYKINEKNKKLEEQTIELKNLNEKLSIMSLKDALTGLYNRAYFDQEIKLIENLNYNSVAILIADLDCMKVVNDRYGHLMGDKYLIEASKILKKSIRQNDVIARIGGDEFAVILYNVDKEGMANLENRIKLAVKKHNLKYNEFHMGISIGWDITKCKEKAIEEVIKNADTKMYKDKTINKNKYLYYSDVKN